MTKTFIINHPAKNKWISSKRKIGAGAGRDPQLSIMVALN